MKRNCSICGKEPNIKLRKDKSYSGGNYFGKLDSRKKEIEYWECNKCFNED